MAEPSAFARFAELGLRDAVEVRQDAAALDEPGVWVVVASFEGELTCVRFAHVGPPALPAGRWTPAAQEWTSSLSRAAYEAGVQEIRARIARGTVYQVNLCRVLSQPLPAGSDLDGLDRLLLRGNPAPHAGRVCVPHAGLDLVCASPEAFLLRAGDRLESRPIKGTAATAAGLLTKDYAENVMIADLVRNDLSPVCRPGSVRVDALCALQGHPGLVHLVTRVSGQLREGIGWADILATTYPPGSVSGAPKSTALKAIRDLEPVPRGPYCGAVGWVDNHRGLAELAVGIRTFWAEHDDAGRRWLRFGAGAGITWGSDPALEWAETELKASRLVGLASGTVRA